MISAYMFKGENCFDDKDYMSYLYINVIYTASIHQL